MKDKVRGAILGTAIGDALGMPAEGKSPETIRELYGTMNIYKAPKSKKGKPFHHNLDRGMWTDDTQLMMAIAQSLIHKKAIDFDDIAKNHVIAFNEKRGWGKATMYSVQRIADGVPWWNSYEIDAAGNGPPMKIAPIGVLFGLEYINQFEMVNVVTNISRMTHEDSRATISAIAQCHLIKTAMMYCHIGLRAEIYHLHNIIRDLERSFGYRGARFSTVFERAIKMAENGESDADIRNEIKAGPFVLESFPFMCALVYKYFAHPDKCLERIINQGGDADTTGSMAGVLLGAAHGYSRFPLRWKRSLEDRKKLLATADRIFKIYG